MKFIVCYDITSDKRRNKISELLENYGLRVQESVFECELQSKFISTLSAMIKRITNAEDSVRFYYVCSECYSKSFGFGKKPENIFDDGFIVF